MAALDVARLVRDDADDFVRRLGRHQGAGVHVDVAAVHDEGVEAVVLDDAHGNVLRGQVGRPEDGLGVVAQQVLDLGIADERQAALGRGGRYGCDDARTIGERREDGRAQASIEGGLPRGLHGVPQASCHVLAMALLVSGISEPASAGTYAGRYHSRAAARG